jgi:hypothetical protein
VTVGAGHAAQMREAEIEGDVGDGRIERGPAELPVKIGQADIEQHLRNRYAEMAAEAELKRVGMELQALIVIVLKAMLWRLP